jgi:hypothetical protein
MTGQIYVERLDPLHVRHKYPLVFIAGNGQTGTVPLSSHPPKLITRPLTSPRTGSTPPTTAQAGPPSSSTAATPSTSPTKPSAAAQRGFQAKANSPSSPPKPSKSNSPLPRNSPPTPKQPSTHNGPAPAYLTTPSSTPSTLRKSPRRTTQRCKPSTTTPATPRCSTGSAQRLFSRTAKPGLSAGNSQTSGRS